MKKLFVLLFMIFTTASFGSGIASNSASAPCTNNTLETYSGNSNLTADWQPNEINIRWYNNNTLMTVQDAANTCTYDDVLNVPSTAPTRVGYTFDGWTVRPEMDFSTINKSEEGNGGWGKCWYSADNKEHCYYVYEEQNCGETSFVDLQRYEWKVNFSHGTLYGYSYCSNNNNNMWGTVGVPNQSLGSYCWCKLTGYKPVGSSVLYSSKQQLSWIYNDCDAQHSYCTGDCRSNCAKFCAGRVREFTAFRTALFTPASN